MGKGGKRAENGIHHDRFTWEEIQKHDEKNDKWIVIENKVYNISTWMKKHPGGARIIGSYAGQDATVSRNLLLCIFVLFVFKHFQNDHIL